MEKVRLTLDELHVQSFATTGGESGGRGTVRAHDAPTDQVECATQNPDWDTCWGTCGGSCGGTCGCEEYSERCTLDDCYTGWPYCTWDGGVSMC